MTDFSIGSGVLQAMQDAGDEPRSDEQYIHDGISQTFGRDALYVYIAQDNKTSRLPFEVG